MLAQQLGLESDATNLPVVLLVVEKAKKPAPKRYQKFLSAFAGPVHIMGEMHADDMDLVREFAASGSEAAFATLVRRHVNLVYSAALRRLGNAPEAEEVAQTVFIILARKARSLRRGTILSGWLYQTAQLTAANFQRAAVRRQHREQEAFMQFSEQSEPNSSWHRLSPLLEEAMARLGQKERDAIVLRFFENHTVREVAVALGLREDAAQKRVNRATDKLRDYFVRRGVQVSTAALLASLGTHAVQAAPAELATKIVATAALKGAVGSGSTLTLIKGALKIMAWTKAKTAIVGSVVVLLAVGTTTITVKEIAAHRNEVWREKYDMSVLERVAPQVQILPAIRSRRGSSWGNNSFGMMGLGIKAVDVVQCAYDGTLGRMIFSDPLPTGNYDFISNLPEGARDGLQLEIKKKFGLVVRRELIKTNVLALTVRNQDAAGLRPSSAFAIESSAKRDRGSGSFQCKNQPISNLVEFLEDYFKTPVVDQTGLTGSFDIVLKGNSTPEGLQSALLNELGLQLVPSREPIEFLVVEKVK